MLAGRRWTPYVGVEVPFGRNQLDARQNGLATATDPMAGAVGHGLRGGESGDE